VHAATFDGDFTVIGSDNNFLAYTHIAHDCQVGDDVVMSNNASLAGHVVMGSHVVMGGFAGVHQFCRIGDRAMVGGMSRISQDVPPFMIVEGSPAVVRAINKVGLERAGFTEEQMDHVKTIFRIFFREGSIAPRRWRNSWPAMSPAPAKWLPSSSLSRRASGGSPRACATEAGWRRLLRSRLAARVIVAAFVGTPGTCSRCSGIDALTRIATS
jgi:hypothetical protein